MTVHRHARALPFCLLTVVLAAVLAPRAAAQEAEADSAGGMEAPSDAAEAPAEAHAADGGAAQEFSYAGCPDELAGPVGAAGVPWGDTLAAASALAAELEADPPSAAGVEPLLRRGDRAVDEGHHTLAYAAYSAAVDAGGGYEALWKAARAAVDVGQDAGEDRSGDWYALAEAHGRRAIDARPGAPEGHLQLAQALGLVALDAGVRERVRLSKEVREEALATIEADSGYAGGWHVLGRWHEGVMELPGFGRFFARTFLGGQVLEEASWEKAERFLERAAELESDRIAHHLELGKVYRQLERPGQAREALQAVLDLPPRDYHDCVYKAEARELLEGLEG